MLPYFIYIFRWVFFAIPGHYILHFAFKYFEPLTAMLISQGVLGALVYWIDRKIILGKGNKKIADKDGE